jgi:hypothetical protein
MGSGIEVNEINLWVAAFVWGKGAIARPNLKIPFPAILFSVYFSRPG